MTLSKKIGIALSALLIIMTVLFTIDLSKPEEEITLGITFSSLQAERLGLDWKETYDALLSEMDIPTIRIPAYWDLIENEKGIYDFTDLNYQLTKAKEKNIEVILALGHRVPRWPECFAPYWSKRLDDTKFEESLLIYIEALVNHLKNYDNITHWQVENEPFLTTFGLCPKPNEDLIKQEIQLVKDLDERPIIITDSGELSLWNKAGKHGDIFGTTMYLKVWNKYIGFFEWLLPASYYQAKFSLFVEEKPFYVMELQAEPWGSKDRFIADIPIDEQLAIFNEETMTSYLTYAKRAGFDHIYLWGAEWWYWLKQKDHPELWDTAKDLF